MDIHAQRTSPFNFVEAVRSDLPDLSKVRICDVTLRDGEQAPDAAFTPEEKVEVAALLEQVGIHQIQAGHAHQDRRTVQLIKQAGIKTPIELIVVGFMPRWKEEIDLSLEAGADVLNIVIRSSDRQIQFLGLSREQTLERTVASIEYARAQGARAILGPSFCTVADLDFLKELARAGVQAGAQGVDIADTVGVARPAAIKFLVREIKAAVDTEVGIHCHNDFGLGTACALAGLEGGATWADVTVSGIGERAGMPSLEEVVLALRCLYGVDLGLKTELLYDLTHTVSRLLRVPVPGKQPITGDNVFAQKEDVHVMVSRKQPESVEPFDPALAGNRRRVRLGKGSGRFSVLAKLEEFGLTATEQQVKRIVAWANATAERDKGFVPDEAVLQFVHRILEEQS